MTGNRNNIERKIQEKMFSNIFLLLKIKEYILEKQVNGLSYPPDLNFYVFINNCFVFNNILIVLIIPWYSFLFSLFSFVVGLYLRGGCNLLSLRKFNHEILKVWNHVFLSIISDSNHKPTSFCSKYFCYNWICIYHHNHSKWQNEIISIHTSTSVWRS